LPFWATAVYAGTVLNAPTRTAVLAREAEGRTHRKGMIMVEPCGIETGMVVAVSISDKKGEKKRNIPSARLLVNHGMEGDAHVGEWHRQVSLLGVESIAKIQAKGLDVRPGDFAENITTQGMCLWQLPIGTNIRIGPEALLEVTQIGKVCHQHCAIFHQVGDCVMPREGIFARVLKEGTLTAGDPIVINPSGAASLKTPGQ
jgi:MOSC domain-containing protein YiiM